MVASGQSKLRGRLLECPQLPKRRAKPAVEGLHESRKPVKTVSTVPEAITDPHAAYNVASAIAADPFPITNFLSSVSAGLIVLLGLAATQVRKPATSEVTVTTSAGDAGRSSESISKLTVTESDVVPAIDTPEETIKEPVISAPEPKKVPANVVEARNWIADFRSRKAEVIVASFPVEDLQEVEAASTELAVDANEFSEVSPEPDTVVAAKEAISAVQLPVEKAEQQAPAGTSPSTPQDDRNLLEELFRVLKNKTPIGLIADLFKRMWAGILRLLGGSSSGAAA